MTATTQLKSSLWRRPLKLLLYIFFIPLLLVLALMLYFSYHAIFGKFGLRLIDSKPIEPYVIGDLGGMPVKIPSPVVSLVQYNDTSGWSAEPQGPPPKRTYQSKLASFGIDFRYPDMALLDSPENWKDKNTKKWQETDWMSLGINAARFGYPDGFLARGVAHIIDSSKETAEFRKYKKLPKKQFGLDVYVGAGTNPRTHQPYELNPKFNNEFIGYDKHGKIMTHISCSHIQPDYISPCSQYFSMEKYKLHIAVYVSYRKYYLKDWRDIQKKAQQLLLSFRVPEKYLENTKKPT